MKIVIGSESFPPAVSGVATMAEYYAKTFAEMGHDVVVFCPSTNPKTFIDKSYHDYKVIRLASHANPFRNGVRVTWRPGKQIKRYLDEAKPDIIHLHDPASISSALLKEAQRQNIPVVITNHFRLDFVISYFKYLPFFHPLIKTLTRSYVRRFYNRCQTVTCPSDLTRRDLKAWGVRPPVLWVSNGVNYERFEKRPDLASFKAKYKLPDKPIVVYVGRVDADKRVDVLLKSISLVQKESDAFFLIVGGGAKLEEMRELTKSLNINDKVLLTGWKDGNDPEFPKFYHAADLFATASPIEVQSIVMMEAMSSGLPIIAPNHGALPELVHDGENGLLFENGNEADLANKIIKLLKDADLRHRLGQKAQVMMAENSQAKSARKMIEIYESLIRGRGKVGNNL